MRFKSFFFKGIWLVVPITALMVWIGSDERVRIDSMQSFARKTIGKEVFWKIPMSAIVANFDTTIDPMKRLICFSAESSQYDRDRAHRTFSGYWDRPFSDKWYGNTDVHSDGYTFRMWYVSGGQAPGYTGEKSSIRMATSTDGIHWQQENGGQPVFEPGPPEAFDATQVTGPSVVYDGKVWRMWYTGLRAPSFAYRWETRYRIGLAISRDGVRWERANNGMPVLDLGRGGMFDSWQVMYPSVLKEERGYRMWYAASSKKLPHSIGMATSSDGINWERTESPVEGLGFYVTGPSVVKIGEEYLIIYVREDLNTNTWHLAAAVSKDGFHWSVLNGGWPICGTGERPDVVHARSQVVWDVDHPSGLVKNGDRVHFWVRIRDLASRQTTMAMATLQIAP